MGAISFEESAYGVDAKSAYEDACQNAIDNGLHPQKLTYKGQLQKVQLPSGANIKNIYSFVNKYLDMNAYSDKYSPMYYFEIPNARTQEVSVPAGVTVVKNSAKGVKKWETVFTVSYEEFKQHSFRTIQKDFKTNVLATEYAKSLAANGIECKLDISKKLNNPALSNVATFKTKYKKVKQKQSLFVFFGMCPS